MYKIKPQKAIAVFGYNNSRIYDVERIKDLAAKEKNAVLILVKQGITSLDLVVTPFCLDADPTQVDLADSLQSFAVKNNLIIIGCLPFSDKGVVGASYAAQQLGLFHDEVETSHAMVDKNQFRKLEGQYIPDVEHRYQDFPRKKPFKLIKTASVA
jgi:hypothetical protein